ncbi:MAG: putative HTH-type transcriptional repressor ExuR [candidate division WS2 bacterium]|uniref:HTH-type transcriptional repressor ExuR n=1 Tax=Psychracetigena formicireducens TaxID=2986056 RepID=A0A9E2BK70_PSYF1|nr:putative HTH-type transcriptional repressor ExuR [Candidatus Psychracetigena formicireducens]
MSALLEEHPGIDSVFCLNDEMALGAITAILETGRNIPKDIAVVGFDDIPMASYAKPSLTTVRVDRRLWGYLASTHLLMMISREVTRHIVKIPVQLIKRHSTGRVSVGTKGTVPLVRLF